MPNKKISELAAATSVTGAELVPFTQGLTTLQARADVLAPLPWLIDINVFMTSVSHINWNTIAKNTQYLTNGIKYNSPSALNDEINFDVILSAGTWTIEVMHDKGVDRGMVEVALDGVAVGTIDGYDAGGLYDVRSNISAVTIAATGKKRLRLKVTGKNASATNHIFALQHIQLRRTA